jgi:hypothetical protein
MSTFTIQIGNSDNKLSQLEWSKFCADLFEFGHNKCVKIWFYGQSPCDKPWQNCCMVVEYFYAGKIPNELYDAIKNMAKYYKQDYIAVTEGITNLVGQ